ncbi:MAG: type I restriction-modification system subunit M [Thermoguttaceae bacterium]
MIDTKKEQERAELFSSIWSVADDLRGSVDGWDFKAYVICTMFYRFLSEKLENEIDRTEHEAGDTDFRYRDLKDDKFTPEIIAGLTSQFGYFIKPSELFCNVLEEAKGAKQGIDDAKSGARKKSSEQGPSLLDAQEAQKAVESAPEVQKAKGRAEEVNTKLADVFRHIEDSAKGTESEENFRGLFSDFDVQSPKLGNSADERIKKIVAVLEKVGEMKLNGADNTIDLFGDAYEYLLKMYASNAGKSGGEFFTPQEVSELLARLTTQEQRNVNKIYDPACGSGSLLLKAYRAARAASDADVDVYGQEINLTTYNMCRINMILHGVSYDKCDIALGDTLIQPKHWDYEPFDVIVSNPPYSIKWEGDKNPTLINDPRFAPAGVLAPKGNADLAFVMHALSWLSNKGAAAIVCFPGVFYRGGSEQKIRRHIVEQNNVDAVIALPDNLFFGTSIATNILVLKKNKKDNRVLFVDATREFVKVTKNNKLTEENIAKIADVVKNRRDIEYFSRVVPFEEIEKNKFNLTPSTYVEKPDTREKIDIAALNAEIKRIVAREEELRRQIDLIVADLEAV